MSDDVLNQTNSNESAKQKAWTEYNREQDDLNSSASSENFWFTVNAHNHFSSLAMAVSTILELAMVAPM